MNRRLLWLGIATFVLALIVILPAGWVAPLLPPQLQCRQWRGSIWNGECRGFTLQQGSQQALQANVVRWNLHPSALLRLKLRAALSVQNDQGAGSGVVELGRAGHLIIEGLSATAVFDHRLASMLPAAWQGQLTVQELKLALANGRLEDLSGDITLRNLHDGRGTAFGSYKLGFADTGPPFEGRLQDSGGPFAVAAVVTISSEQPREFRWQIKGSITPRPEVPPAMRSRLDLLGSADSDGRYPLSLEGLFR